MTRPFRGPAPQSAYVFDLEVESETRPVAEMTEDLLEGVVREHAQLLFRIAYLVLRNRHDAEDATQETFMRVLQYRRKLEGIRHVKSWLARIAWRVAIERKKRRDFSLSEIETGTALSQLRSQLIVPPQFEMEKTFFR